ncbi:hypothetical protein ACSBR1_020191 [Camellia fascicularis]
MSAPSLIEFRSHCLINVTEKLSGPPLIEMKNIQDDEERTMAERLIKIVRHGVLSTLDEQILESTNGDESTT